MPPGVPPPSDVLAVVITSWVCGTAVVCALSRTWGEVRAGHFKVMWMVCAGLAAVAGVWHRPAWGLAIVAVAAFAAVYLNKDLPIGIVAGAVAIGVLAVTRVPMPLGMVTAAAAALLLGGVSNAMMLGHWHLNQPGLATGPLRRLVWILWAGIVAFAASAVAIGVAAAASDAPEAGTAMLGAVTAGAFTVFAGVLTAMVTHLVSTRSIMSATGILYLAVLLCLVAAFTGTLGALSAI